MTKPEEYNVRLLIFGLKDGKNQTHQGHVHFAVVFRKIFYHQRCYQLSLEWNALLHVVW